jgi:flagellar basal-body rod modification protein FlgD
MVYDVSRLDAATRQAAPAADSKGASAGSATNTGTIAMSTFLQLIVAQIKNQNPLNPTDGSQFVAQLAGLQQLQQSVYTGQDVAQIRTDLDTLLGDSGGTVPAGS